MLTLLTNGLFVPQAEAWQDLIVPGLQRLLSRGKAEPSLGHWLQALPGALGLTEPVADVWAQLDGITGEEPYWLLARPFYSVSDHQGVYAQAAPLQLTESEQQHLLDDLNRHLAQDGLKLYVGHSGQWYLNLPVRAEGDWADWSLLPGQHLYRYWPQATEQAYYTRLLTELQMLLYRHPVNEARRQQALPEASALWLWGGQPSRTALASIPLMLSDEPLVKALARAHSIPCQDLAQADRLDIDNAWLIATDLQPLFWQDPELWQQQVLALDRLCVGKALSLHDTRQAWSMSGWQRWQIWRRFSGWAAYLGVTNETDGA